MSIGRWCAVVSCLCLASPVAAQSTTDTRPAASGRPVAAKTPAADAQATGPDVVVNGVIDRTRGSWKRAESDHVVIIGTDSAAELTRLSNNLEKLYGLLSRLYRRGDDGDDVAKMHVTLIDSSAAFQALELGDLRSQQGPYPSAFTEQAYYDPREDGDVLAIARSNQIIDLNTSLAYDRDCEDAMANGAQDCIKAVSFVPPAARTWEQILYSSFARRFILTYQPAAYPLWYIDGIGALFSTMSMKSGGGIDYGAPPSGYRNVFRSYGDVNVGDILAGRYLDGTASKTAWTPYHAWLLAHYFVFSNLKPERSRQFHDYMTAIRLGKPMAEAARAFGDMGALQRDVLRYSRADKSFARAGPPAVAVAAPSIGTLSPANAKLVEARIELAARIAAPPTIAGGGPALPSAADARRRTGWLAQLRAATAQLPEDNDAILFVAEAECRGGDDRDCLADADHVLAKSPDNVAALAWKGVALTDQAVAGPAADRARTIALARATLQRAITRDATATMPLIAYFQSFTKLGERVPDEAMLGMAKVIRLVPAAPAPRLYLAQELVRQGRADIASRVVHVVLHGAYDSPERKAAAALFGPAGTALPAGR